MRALRVLLLSSLLSACEAEGPLDLAWDPPQVVALVATAAPGDRVPLRIRNTSALSWNYSACGGASGERLVDGVWTPLPPVWQICPSVMYGLQAGGVLEHVGNLPADAPAGTYRFAMRFSREGGRVEFVTSQPVTVSE